MSISRSLKKEERHTWDRLYLSVPLLLILLWYFCPVPQAQVLQPIEVDDDEIHLAGPIYSGDIADLELQAPRIPPYSLTAILPVTWDSIAILEDTLLPLLKPSTCLREIVLVCPRPILSQAQAILRKVLSLGHDSPDVLLHPLIGGLEQSSGIVSAASQVSTDWILYLDHEGLMRATDRMQDILLNPPAISIPIGPKGFYVSSTDVSCIPMSDSPQPASYLYPPVIAPTSIAEGLHTSGVDLWADLGKRVSEGRADGLGGIVIHSETDWCTSDVHSAITSSQEPLLQVQSLDDKLDDTCIPDQPEIFGRFTLLLPTLNDLRLLSPLGCMLRNKGHTIEVFVYDEFGGLSSQPNWEDRNFTAQQCTLQYTIASGDVDNYPGRPAYLYALQILTSRSDVAIFPREDDALTTHLAISQSTRALQNITVVRIPRGDFPQCTWMGSLSLAEWRNWNIPGIDISIITKDRPHSLARLLTSLSKGIFFGDTVDLRLHLEQSSDRKTMKMVESIPWTRGRLFVHHRVIHGGLLPAVVESWYPRSNDSYGLLLEDDVELSPLFYAWAKMSLLRYRYGDLSNRSPRMFGISLYQQKNLELPAEGRRPFNAGLLFNLSGTYPPSMPYLSPVPCSWGAVYFPEHWREFHDYLAIRLSEFSMKIGQIVVPGVRSNNWTKSWKKYFIELVYLRGYVMLYPNYPDFVSLSTNHLEVGSHVKVRTVEKQEQFILPLMELPVQSSLSPIVELLDLPDNTLPRWNELPVLNLTGSLTTLASLATVGFARRIELTGCTNTPALFDVRDLMCIAASPPA